MRYTIFTLLLATFAILTSCKKDEFLSSKPNDALVVPTTLSDFQSILDNNLYMNGTDISGGLTPAIGDASSDDYFLLDSYLSSADEVVKNIYLWKKNIFVGAVNEDIAWSKAYKTIFYSNVVLTGLESLSNSEKSSNNYSAIKGSALFFRAFSLWQLCQVFTPQFENDNSESQIGIPLRLSNDINEPIKRASLKTVYNQIVADLNSAAELVPITVAFNTRPSRAAVFAMLARVYLSMRSYNDALTASNASLALTSELLDYSTIPQTSSTANIMPKQNPEIIFYAVQLGGFRESFSLAGNVARIDTSLYNSYSNNDLRKKLFFRDRSTEVGVLRSFRGSYTSTLNFTGLSVDEMYLTRAECLARQGQTGNAMKDLNSLLAKRYTKNTFVDLVATTSDQAMALILAERRKELIFRGLRWTDLRRLNKDDIFKRTLVRKVNNVLYTLLPNDLNYTLPIPLSVLSFNPTMPQNDRK